MRVARGAGVPVLEDCAQAQEAHINGRPVGSLGDGAAFSFYPTKILGAIGDGGMFASIKSDVADAARSLRTYGWSKQAQFADQENGRCSRLDPIQAAILAERLTKLDREVERRRAIAKRYNEAFADLPLITPFERPGCRHVYHLYVVRSDRRDALMGHMKSAEIGVGLHYPFPVHRQPALVKGARIPMPLTVTEKLAGEILSLPMFPSLSDNEVDTVITAVRTFFGKA
jgi:dTDP-4-amino-4,6-dideoxygalactose transaminase